MIKDGTGGGKTTTGKKFEKENDLLPIILEKYPHLTEFKNKTAGKEIHYEGSCFARTFKKHEFYSFLKENNIDWKKIVSKRLLPDDALLLIKRKTLFIIEVKYQQTHGSVDEKLQTCDFKRKQYEKLVRHLGLKVKYIYVLNDWFKRQEYIDTLEYIESVECAYMINTLPFDMFEFPDK